MAVALRYEQVAGYAPLSLSIPGLTEQQFIEWTQRFPDFRLEYSADGELIIMPGTSLETGERNSEITRQLGNWTLADGRGRSYDSSTSFFLPSGARLSPDASWVLRDRKHAVQRPGVTFPMLAPDFVIELKSPSDRLKKLAAKMEEWIENGVQLGWLIDPEKQTVIIYRQGRAPETMLKPTKVAGEGPVAGFTLDLGSVWNAD